MTPTEIAPGPPGSAPPISPELWARLKRLDAACEIAFVRMHPLRRPAGDARSRVWVATIRPYATNFMEIFQAQHPTLGEAVRLVVEEAERRGWGQARAAP